MDITEAKEYLEKTHEQWLYLFQHDKQSIEFAELYTKRKEAIKVCMQYYREKGQNLPLIDFSKE